MLSSKLSYKKIFYRKNLFYFLSKFKLKIYGYLNFFPSLILLFILFILFKTILIKYKKIISLRINRKYFGHLSIEPAILSAFCSQKKGIFPFVSFKKDVGINNKILETIARKTFQIRSDFLIMILENIYNYSSKNIKSNIENYYKPLFHQNLETREITYIDLLDTQKTFAWRMNAESEITNKNKNDFKLIVALRTKFFNEKNKNVASQPWRDASSEDIIYICKIFAKIINPKKIFLFYHPKDLKLLQSKDLRSLNINLINETKVDILTLFSHNSILVNNGNGIGAAALAIGVKTLYIHHTFWHFWHTSHANAVCLPSLFLKSNSDKNKNIEEIISLAFSPKSKVPLNFNQHYFPKGIQINKIRDIKEEVLIKTLEEISFSKNHSNKYKENYMGCDFEFANEKERNFWKIYISNLPEVLRRSHKLIKLNISKSFLEDF